MTRSEPIPTARRASAVAVAGGLVAVLAVALAWGGGDRPVSPPRAAPTATTPADPGPQPLTLDPRWPRRLTLLSDSVGLGSIVALRETMDAWRVRVLGRPALMVDDAAAEIRRGGPVDRVVVVALGYNSLWRRDRVDHEHFATTFDEHAEALLTALRSKGARKLVWVTLRDADRSHVPSDAWHQHATYAWYFPYVNERLRRLDRRTGDLVLADWSAVSDRSGITYDAFHLDPDGALLYARIVRDAVLDAEVTPAR